MRARPTVHFWISLSQNIIDTVIFQDVFSQLLSVPRSDVSVGVLAMNYRRLLEDQATLRISVFLQDWPHVSRVMQALVTSNFQASLNEACIQNGLPSVTIQRDTVRYENVVPYTTTTPLSTPPPAPAPPPAVEPPDFSRARAVVPGTTLTSVCLVLTFSMHALF